VQGTTAASISSAIIIVAAILGGTLYVTQQNQANQSQLSSLNAQVVAPENKPAVTEAVVSEVTTVIVSTSLVTTTSTVSVYPVSVYPVSVYPVPSNVTVFFTGVSENYDYQMSSSSTSISGYTGQNNLAIPVNNLFQGETLTISVSCNTVGGSSVNAPLYVNGSMVARTGCAFSVSGQITYTV
jgi:hypothetical protein